MGRLHSPERELFQLLKSLARTLENVYMKRWTEFQALVQRWGHSMTLTYEPKKGRLKLLLRVIDLRISGAMTTLLRSVFLSWSIYVVGLLSFSFIPQIKWVCQNLAVMFLVNKTASHI